MRTSITVSDELFEEGFRIDASYHSSLGVKSMHHLQKLVNSGKIIRLDYLGDVSTMFVGDWLKRIYVEDSKHGAPYISGDSILRMDPLDGCKYLSFRHGDYIQQLSLYERMILMSCSGTIGRLLYVTSVFNGVVGSPDLLRILAKPGQIQPGYLYAYLSSHMGAALIQKGIYGAVVQHIEIPHMGTIPIPRLEPQQEERIHQLIGQAAELRVEADQRLRATQDRFYRQVLGVDPSEIHWRFRNEHAFATRTTNFHNSSHRLDSFHHVGYVAEAERYLGKTIKLGKLVDPVWPPPFKRPFTGKEGIAFISGMDLYNYYPIPRVYISRKMVGLDTYLVRTGTILIQRSGQRYGLFGRPTILPSHLNNIVVSEDLLRIYPKNDKDRGFVYIWLSTEVGRRLLLKHSFGTSMGKLSENGVKETAIPDCLPDIRLSFESDVQYICEIRERANELEDQAQVILARALRLDHVN